PIPITYRKRRQNNRNQNDAPEKQRSSDVRVHFARTSNTNFMQQVDHLPREFPDTLGRKITFVIKNREGTRTLRYCLPDMCFFAWHVPYFGSCLTLTPHENENRYTRSP